MSIDFAEREDRHMKTLEELQKDYAELIVKAGLNVQKGQRLVISCPVNEAFFARLCARVAYEAGCKEVIMRWSDDDLTRYKYLYAADEIFDNIDHWIVEMLDTLSIEGAAFLSIYAEDPQNLKDADPDRIKRAQISSGKALENYRNRMTRNDCPWCVVSVPTKAWAKAVFPELSEEDAVTRLWDEILNACRVDGGDAAANWSAHTKELMRHVEIMNSYNFRYLRYHNAAGTDVTLELPEGHFWAGGEEVCKAGYYFSANIPTEEVFTLPKRDSINGKLVATRPLCLNGSIVENFYFIVKDGKIVEAHAEKGEEILKNAISVDEGASYFGEVALVPYDSPIQNSGVLFLNTLFDENASCHFAFGEAYPCIKGSEGMTEDELKARGVNFSITHEDFMVGSADLSIIGTTWDGEEVEIFRNGNFTF